MAKLKLLFMGSPIFAVPALAAAVLHPGVDVIGVVTQPDQPKGRGKQLAQTAVNSAAQEAGIPVHKPSSKKVLVRIVEETNPDLIVVVAYGRILPARITDNYPCVNIHGSLLPQYRGASPIHASLMNGDLLTGVTLIRMNEKMDEGDILLRVETSIFQEDSFQTLHDRLSSMGGDMLTAFLDAPDMFLRKAINQDSKSVSYCQKLQSEDTLLDAQKSASENFGRIRAFSPLPGAYVLESGKRIKIIEASLSDGGLMPTVVKPEGKGLMSYADYKRGKGPISFFE
jgi:methionyl-tRNA formyltransferase